MKFRAVLFDLDGTLLDTIEDLADSMNAVLDKFGFPVHDIKEYKYFIGDGIANLVRRALPPESRSEETINCCVDAMRQEYGRRWADKTCPYRGIPELLDGLHARGLKMAVLSNKLDEVTKLVVAKLLPRWKFEFVLGERPLVPKKPNPAAALEIARLMNIRPCEFLYLGDTSIDMKTANAAGMYAVGALWGFREAGELTAGGAKILIENPVDLLALT